ncbi:hypothetical protein GCM10008107_12950 [Psychrosphaera saromensis]|uniref:Uncharacterized protein n=1 Tax=Psychrosphaera saromensis TaxID=716813 RepID=A0A2S7UUQ3_9GAMM|nr:hypothetical protein [Psychrosphaera saromensis]PQJ53458.1 hypothetical protein BTO11_07115 [Psychrosphaera saromensis]GHB65353.1 hypothetical protein GCM10008107_12950 [Psychrosphaera saromensis]GLQ14751.1 hypothetical protein GCM10007917_22060 [Psychrosphaera saromensis]
MFAKAVKMFFYVLLYFAIISLIGVVLVNNQAPSSIMLTFIISVIVLFVPIFIVISNKVFRWKAETNTPVSVEEIEKRLSKFTVNDLTFTYDVNKGVYLLSPFEYTLTTRNEGRVENKTVKFYIKLWLDEANKKATFCDYLIETKKQRSSIFSVFGSGETEPQGTNSISSYFSMGKIRQKGMITLSTSATSSDGESFKFSTSAIHEELINLFTKNGWSVQGKVF